MPQTPYNFVNDQRLNDLKQWLADVEVTYDQMSIASADAGFRRYFRLHKDNNTRIAVDAPPEFEDTNAFLNIAKKLVKSGLRAPHIHCYSLEKGFLVVEDFGKTHFQQALEKTLNPKLDNKPLDSEISTAEPMYQKAIQAIIQMQQSTEVKDLPAYDEQFLKTELQLFPTWYINRHLKLTLTPDQQAVIDETFTLLICNAIEQPQTFVHRDFHCRNLMLLDNHEIGIIDFQGAMAGPVTYDPASLLKDAYLDWPKSFREPLMEQHRITLDPAIDKKTYQRWFDFMGLQRHLKILGIFSRLNYRDNKPHYLNNLGAVKKHIDNTLLDYPELTAFANLFRHLHKEST